MTERVGKSELLNLIETEYGRLETTLAGLTTHQLMQVGVTEQWSIKDVLAHLTFWQKHLLDELQKLVKCEPLPKLSVEGEDWSVTMDKINEQNFVTNQNRTLEEVRADFENSYQEILRVVCDLDTMNFKLDSTFEQAFGGASLFQAIGSETYEHYQEHNDAILNWLNNLSINLEQS